MSLADKNVVISELGKRIIDKRDYVAEEQQKPFGEMFEDFLSQGSYLRPDYPESSSCQLAKSWFKRSRCYILNLNKLLEEPVFDYKKQLTDDKSPIFSRKRQPFDEFIRLKGYSTTI